MAQEQRTVCVALAATALLAGCSHPADTSKIGTMSSTKYSPPGMGNQPHLTGAALAQQIQQIQNNPSIPANQKVQIMSHMQEPATTAP